MEKILLVDDEQDILEFIEPSISSVSQPTHKSVIRAVELLMAHLNDLQLANSVDNCFFGELKLRNSVRAL